VKLKNWAIVICLGFGIWLLGFAQAVNSATLTSIRVASFPQKIRIVFDFEGQAYYGVVPSEEMLTLALVSCEVEAQIEKIVEVNDWVIRYMEVQKVGENLFIRIPLNYPVTYKIFPLGCPSRVVLDFGRTFTKVQKGAQIAKGVDFFKVVKGGEDGCVTAQVLKVDPRAVDIFPALARKNPGLFESVASFLKPGEKKIRHPFLRDQVSNMVSQQGGAAGVNGTYFSDSGRPLGVLMIAGEVVSYPISDRTALILTEDGKVYIDNIALDAYFDVNGSKFEITGINEPRESQQDIVLFTSYYGELTKTDRFGYELTVNEGKLMETRIGNSRIPEDGYVLSLGPVYAEHVNETVKVGDEIKTVINLIPYSTSVKGKIMHLVGGGPRLVKSGRIYISKYEERFRRDIAKGRAARTAVGITEDNKLLFVTVDSFPRSKGKNKTPDQSIGMSLTELAYFMQSLGVGEALNLDGGSSTTMVVNGQVVNQPVIGSQRQVSNAIIIKSKT
jgi:exopolysaccharide biosynthesis protein